MAWGGSVKVDYPNSIEKAKTACFKLVKGAAGSGVTIQNYNGENIDSNMRVNSKAPWWMK